jgi:DNA-binding PadR family transcriptional regulator
MEEECHKHLDKSDEQSARDAVLHALGKEKSGGLSRNRIERWSRSWNKLDERVKNAAIDGLVRDGLVTTGSPKKGSKERVMLALTEEGRQCIKGK